MSSIPGRPKRLESVISICLSAILFLIATAIFLKQFHFVTREPCHVPRLSHFAPAGFKVLSQIETYTAENLYEKINGKAPLYTESGFRELLTQRFVSKETEGLWLELFVFDMGALRNAFSVFSRQRRAKADILSIFHPDFGYRAGNALYFVHGKYYIELVGASESKALFNAMAETAIKIQKNFATTDTQRPEFSLLPENNRIPGSMKLYLKDAFGFSGFNNIFTARYEIDGKGVTAFLSRQSDAQTARSLAESYYKFLIDNGAAEKTDSGFDGGKVVDFYGLTEIIFSNGVYIGGVHEAESIDFAVKTAVMLKDNLSEAAKK